MNIQLYIQDYEVELSDDIQFPLCRTFEELSNPVAIINDWSKSIGIKQTVNNMRIFGNIFNIERSIVDSDIFNDGIYFNPSKKADFKLIWNNQIVMCGYCKLSEVNNVSKTFTINLFGEMGNTFQEMLKCTFNNSEDIDEKYLIENPLSDGLKLDRFLVSTSYENDEPTLKLDGCSDTDIIGFFPTIHGLNDDFDSKTFETNNGEFKTFAEVLNEGKGIDYGETIIGDGLDEIQFGEFRSYYQKPYIYVNKLWQIIEKKSKEICNFPLRLDYKWFNSHNPYYTNLIYICSNVNLNGGDSSNHNTYTFTANLLKDYRNTTYRYDLPTTSDLVLQNFGYDEVIKKADFTNGTIDVSGEEVSISGSMNLLLRLSGSGIKDGLRYNGLKNNMHFNKNNALIVEVYETEPYVSRYLVVSSKNKYTYNPSDYDGVIVVDDKGTYEARTADFYWKFAIPVNSYTGNDANSKMHIRAYWANNDVPMLHVLTKFNPDYMRITNEGGVRNPITLRYYFSTIGKRSGRTIRLQDIWNPELKPFDILLNYAKMFGLVFVTDYKNKEVFITHRSEYFKDYSIIDWTNKVDTTNKYTIKQPTFEQKYILFNYDSVDADMYKEYEDEFRIAYGSKRLITSYEFNNDEKKLYDNINPFIAGNEYVSSWTQIYNEWEVGKPIGKVYNEEIYMFDKKDGKSANIANCFAFRGKNQPTNNAIRSKFITDDTPMQLDANTYCYIGSNDSEYRLPISELPKITFITDDMKYSSLFNLPNRTFFNTSAYPIDGSIYLYDAFWRDFINERYSDRNKVITTHIQLSPIDYMNFAFNKFVMIGNTLFVVNKIKDFDISSQKPTEVELITINSIDAYKSGMGFEFGQFSINYLEVGKGITKRSIILSASNEWEIESDSDWIRVEPNNGEEGEIKLTLNFDLYIHGYDYSRFGTIRVLMNGEVMDECTIEQEKTQSVIGYTAPAKVNTPYTTDGFGAEFVDSTFNNGHGEWVFNGDVNTIPVKAFSGLTTITSVELPDDLSGTISLSQTFGVCSSLTSISLPDSLSNVTYMSYTFTKNNTLTSVVLPDSLSNVTYMSSLFYDCPALSSVVLPADMSKVKTIGSLFHFCSSLTSISFPDTLNSISRIDSAFYQCYSLTSVVFPQSMSSLKYAKSAFRSCRSLTSVVFNCSLNNLLGGTNISEMFFACSALVDLRFTSLPSADLTTWGLNTCTALSHASLLNILGALPNTATPHTITLGATNLAKLNDMEKRIAYDKGWNLN